MQCNFCFQIYKFQCRKISHEKTCKFNPNKPLSTKIRSNQYIKAKELGLPKPIMNGRKWTNEEKRKQGELAKKSNAKFWSNPANKEKHSRKMKEVVSKNPESYSKNNVSGRAKIYEINDSFGPTKVKGSWELEVGKWLNDNSLKWTNSIKPYNYYWNNSWHLYFPDFYLIDLDILIEVKGYKTARDDAKWQAVTKPFFVLVKSDLDNLDKRMQEIMVINKY